jgi:hypothetical protein
LLVISLRLDFQRYRAENVFGSLISGDTAENVFGSLKVLTKEKWETTGRSGESTGRSQNISLIVPLFTFAGHYRGIHTCLYVIMYLLCIKVYSVGLWKFNSNEIWLSELSISAYHLPETKEFFPSTMFEIFSSDLAYRIFDLLLVVVFFHYVIYCCQYPWIKWVVKSPSDRCYCIILIQHWF